MCSPSCDVVGAGRNMECETKSGWFGDITWCTCNLGEFKLSV